MPYVGWKIFAHEFDQKNPSSVSVRTLLDEIRGRFSGDDWLIEILDGGLKLSHVESSFEVKVKVQANDFTFNYDTGTRTETYLLVLESECLAWKQSELKHKKLMEHVSRRLPSWWPKLNCHVEDGNQLILVYTSKAEPGFDPFPITPRTWLELPIPEETPRTPKALRFRVVKRPPKRPKQRTKVNTLKELMNQVEKEKAQKKRNRNGH
jgi:hypothetical protein